MWAAERRVEERAARRGGGFLPDLLRRMAERVLRGDPRRRTRFHDLEGHHLPWRGLADLLPCALSTLLRKTGRRLTAPWLPYPAVRYLRRLVAPSWSVLEFGSGASTLWLAHRAARVVSVEHDPSWFVRVERWLQRAGRANVEQHLCTGPGTYADTQGHPARSFHLVLIDGHWRNRCATVALRAVRPGGYVYFDNSDVPTPDHRQAVEELLATAAGSLRFVGFAPGNLCVNQGLLIRTAEAQGRRPASTAGRG
jgi:predicted O-methyltransferase YrrM